LLAFLHNEPGAEKVASVLPECLISSVNLAETYSKLARHGTPLENATYQVDRLQIPVIPFDYRQAVLTASVHSSTREHGLSLADCACLALGMAEKAVVVTADRKWAMLKLDVEIVQVR
jgi:PIN domain nuclease of toxin-antitoxin system